ncbi:sensory box histidine kinase/response regulator [Legionella lansingensis]|uniref:histidine kinase n=1 Tax=Legionella lansingensis TaxID=45067 RepID=A0A0W0VU70_9GAMM|nr:sensory box histidine kinase/response regulator [Legionella lansingensis]SNV52316.1 sensory box histidine kinase/response regulator [Legionella lansingensis]
MIGFEENLTNTIIDHLPAQIFWKDCNLIYQGCNTAFVKSLGLHSKEEIIGKSDFDLPVSEKNSARYRADDRKIIQSKEPKLGIEEYQILNDGTERVLSTSKVPLLNKKGEVCGVLGIYIDITDRIKMERSLAKAKEQAELSNKAKTEFIANMSHDIRTPVSGIIGISKLLEERFEHPEEKQYAHWINESGQQLLSLLNSVLDIISASHSLEKDLIEEEFDLHQTLKNLVNLELPTIKLKGLELKLDFDPKIKNAIITDRTKLVRILLNLIGNAIKFTDKGSVGVNVREVETLDDHQLLEFTIWDTGIGIPAELQQQVFERFYRVNPSYKGKYDGHGVGLHIVRNYLTLLGSEIKLESEPEVGTKVTFILRVKLGEPLSISDSSSTSSEHEIRRMDKRLEVATILLVEDNPVALRIAESLIQRTGCRYVSALNGEEALSLIGKNDFDLVLTDIGLPGMSGQELSAAIRSLPETNKNSIPIIGLTAHAVKKVEEDCLKAGMDKILTKPLSIRILQDILEDFLTNKKFKASIPPGYLGYELPETEQDLFKLENFPLFDANTALINLGSKETVKELLDIMLHDNLPQEELDLRKAYQEKRWDNIEKIAHKLKSSALYCGTIKLRYACQYLERYRKAGHLRLQEELYHQLHAVIMETKKAIQDWLISV